MSSRWGGTPQCPRCQKAVYMAEQVFRIEFKLAILLTNKFFLLQRLLDRMVHGIRRVLLVL
jgi:hypothetical protein